MTLLEEYRQYTEGRRHTWELSNDDPKKTAFTFASNLLCRQAFGEIWDKASDKDKEELLETWVKIASIPFSEKLPLRVIRRRRVTKKQTAREEPR